MIDVRTTPAPIETVTPIKPSEAIRLGCIVAPEQAFGAFVDGPGTACALGAMAFGWGWDGDQPYGDRLSHPVERALDSVMAIPDTCPACHHGSNSVGHLNDDHRWSRERIADWLESLGL